MIAELPVETKNHLLRIFNRIWTTGNIPNQWKIANVIPIPKPGKDPTNPQNYRPIALTSVLCKTMERIVNLRLLEFLESRYILDKYQCGGRRGRSTIDHLVRFETLVRNSFVLGNHTIAVSFDMQKAYDMTWKMGIVRDLQDCGLRGRMLGFVWNFLKNRTFKVIVNNTTSDSYRQVNGIPQGSVLSPTLFIVKINRIMSSVTNLPHIKYFLYMDDLLLSTSHPDLDIAGRTMQSAIDQVQRWSILNGFTFAPAKTSAVHFTDKQEMFREPDLHLNQVQIKFEDSIKFLGLIFDKKLTFRQHIQSVRARCNKAMNLIKTISSHVWGADQESIMRVYRALVRSIMDYGGIVYSSASATTRDLLEPIANQAMRLASGAFRSTPIASLRNTCCEPSLSIRWNRLSITYYLKIRSLINNPAFESVTSVALERLFLNKGETPPLSIRVKSLLEEWGIRGLELPVKPAIKQFEYKQRSRWSLRPPGIELHLASHPKETTPPAVYLSEFRSLRQNKYRNFECIFTDGSKSQAGVGCAAVYEDQSEMQPLPTHASIFTAEIEALRLAIEISRSNNFQNTLICSDSRSVLQTIANPRINHPIANSVQLIFDELLSSGKNITLCWVPGHSNIQGNERADEKAKQAGQQPTTYYPLPYTDYYPLIEEKITEMWTREWTNSHTKMLKIKNHVKKWRKQDGLTRREEVVLNRLRIGHSKLTHGYLMESNTHELPPICHFCEDDLLTVGHVFVECQRLRDQRRTHLNYCPEEATIKTKLGKTADVKKVLGFLRAIDIFDEI